MTPPMTTREKTADHAELARLAEAAYSSGPWEAHSIEHPYEATKGPLGVEFPAGSYSEWQIRTAWVHGQAKGKVSVVGLASGRDGASVWLHKDDAAFIAAFNPATAKNLLSEIAALKGERDDAIDRYQIAHDQTLAIGARATQAERQRDELRKAMPDLSSVIAWLDNGCEPKHAVTELGIYKARIDQVQATQGADQ